MGDDQPKTEKGVIYGPRGEAVPILCAHAVDAANSVVPIEALEGLCNSFQRSARRWEIIVYPSIVALIAMTGGAFFFIYTLTRDMRDLALQMEPQLGLSIIKVAELGFPVVSQPRSNEPERRYDAHPDGYHVRRCKHDVKANAQS